MESFFLVCFLVGLGLTVVSFALGATHSFEGGHGGHAVHAGHGAHSGADTHSGHGAHSSQSDTHAGLSFGWLGYLNTLAITAFLTWFGGVGYILTHVPAVVAPLAVVGAGAAGVVGAAGINLFLTRVLARGETGEAAGDESLPGTAARVTSEIYSGGAGEITFTFGGITRTASARTASGLALPRGAEVVVLKVERGVAYVETWDRALAEPEEAQGIPPPALPPAVSR